MGLVVPPIKSGGVLRECSSETCHILAAGGTVLPLNNCIQLQVCVSTISAGKIKTTLYSGGGGGGRSATPSLFDVPPHVYPLTP